ncbi:MAG: DinB family protein [Gemmatimonadetes bacterium]|nr:DinB family protein [Gemmatimonadota bacterium]
MKPERIPSPEADEYAPFYAGYVALARERDPLGLLKRQAPVLRATCTGMTDAEAHHRYAPGKWSIKEVLGHLADTERILSYRLLRISRGDPTPLSGFDENAYVAAAGFDARPVRSLLTEFESVRAATLRMIEAIPPEALTRRGTANGVEVSARALVFILAGHVEHHFEILRQRYKLAVPHIEAPPA